MHSKPRLSTEDWRAEEDRLNLMVILGKMEKTNAGLVFLLVLLSIAGTTTGLPSALFGFGDSYADTGNQNHIVSSWRYPYGMTWPGRPTGRFGNGRIQTDFIADKVGLPSPTPYVDMDDNSIATGVNFALGGSGVTYALGVLPLGTQLDNFEVLLRKGIYSDSFLADSITLVSNSGNDYNANYSNQEFLVVVQEVVQGLTLALERMYDFGLRNVLVANLPPIDCIPLETAPSDYSVCRAAVAPLIDLHNSLLLQSVQQLNTRLPNANFLILHEWNAFTYVLNNTEQYGIMEKLEPCCKPKHASKSCGDVNFLGIPQYKVCDDPTTHVYWDSDHPVESTWKAVVDLFYNTSGFVIGANTLESWLSQTSVKPPPAPASAPALAPGLAAQGGALGQLHAAYEALFGNSDYAESIGLLEAVNLEEHLYGLPNQTVTVFLPDSTAWYTISTSTIVTIYGTDQVLPAIEFHVVQGYYNSSELKHGAKTLTTISGLSLQTKSILGEVLVGKDLAFVVKPDLYNVEGQVVVHGINQFMLPPELD